MPNLNENIKKIVSLQEEISNVKKTMEPFLKKLENSPQKQIVNYDKITDQQIYFIKGFLSLMMILDKKTTIKIIAQLDIKKIIDKKSNKQNLPTKRSFSNRYL